MSRPGGRPRRAAASVRQLPYQSLVNRYAPIEILSSDQVEAIIAAALSILENQGMRFLEASSRRLLHSAGAQVDEATMQVRFDRALVLEKLALAPPQFRLRARNSAHDLVIGGTLRVVSVRDEGTTIEASAPLAADVRALGDPGEAL